MNDIPRYKASFPLQRQFVTNADSCGDNLFTQIERSGNFAIYKRSNMDGRVLGFEVVTVKTVKAGTVFSKGAKPTESDYESYPGGKAFGKYAWFCLKEEHAFDRFDKLVTSA